MGFQEWKKVEKLEEKTMEAKSFQIFFTRHASQRIVERCGIYFLDNTVNYLKNERRFVFMKRRDAYFLFVPIGIFLVGVFENKEKFVVKTTLYPSLYEKEEILKSNRLAVNVKNNVTVIIPKYHKNKLIQLGHR